MFKVAIVEDNGTAAEKLYGLLMRYATEDNETFDITVFDGTVSFLSNYESIYDMALMDIELPYIDEMEAAKRLRTLDGQAVLVFTTNTARYAVKDHEVDALDCLVKPIRYGDFKLKLRQVVLRCSGDQEATPVVHQNGFLWLKLQEIYYIEVRGHTLISHMETDSIQGSGTLLEMKEKLRDKGLLRCNKCHLVNQKHIVAIQGYTLVMTGGEELQISQSRRETFMNEPAETPENEYVL